MITIFLKLFEKRAIDVVVWIVLLNIENLSPGFLLAF